MYEAAETNAKPFERPRLQPAGRVFHYRLYERPGTVVLGYVQSARAVPTVSRIINQWKGIVTKRTGRPIWQKGFYDHIIRDHNDFLTKWTYIDTNPACWREDQYCEG